MDTKRLILFVIFSFSIVALWDAWQQKDAPTVAVAEQQEKDIPAAPTQPLDAGTPSELPVETGEFNLQNSDLIKVNTDLFQANISTIGGDLRQLTLNKHRADNLKDGQFKLMDASGDPMLYVAQTGLIGGEFPTHKSQFTTQASSYALNDSEESLSVTLVWDGGNGVVVNKIYTFHRGSYVIDVDYQINNQSAADITPSAYYQILHDGESKQGSAFMPTFTGGAYFTEADKFTKLSFDEISDENLSLKAKEGWIGIVEHYFVSAWIPKAGTDREFSTKEVADNVYAVRALSPLGTAAAGETLTSSAKLFAGPQTAEDLKAAAPGLEYAVDYGWLTVIAKPLFWLLTKIHGFVGNWGVAIILLTVLIKALFFKLSASSYRSMAQLRELSPRLQSMKEKFGDDKQKMQQAMMELYRTEKINPLGGCLPILVQIPVFIALYWVLLGSVELRHAPFFGWIQDLSAQDPYYILPILMGATMIAQTFLNPPPTDPIQAKVMKIMPVVFSIFFFFFPAGLVLYWLVNNMLSIAQQWYINKTIHAEAIAKKGSAAKRK